MNNTNKNKSGLNWNEYMLQREQQPTMKDDYSTVFIQVITAQVLFNLDWKG